MTKKQLSKSPEEYLANNGWSSALFLEHAKLAFTSLPGVEIKVGRTVVVCTQGDKTVKVYVHHNGRSKEYLTITDKHGRELWTFHYTDTPHEVLQLLRSCLLDL